MIWIVLAVVALVTGGVVAYRAGRARQAALPPPAAVERPLLERTIRDLRVDDVVQHDGRDYLVDGVVEYDEDGHVWRAARVVDAGEPRWIVVGLERGSSLTIRLLTDAPDVELTGYPPETIQRGDATYKLAQRGNATVTFQGNLASIPGAAQVPRGSSLRCRWWRYQAAGEKTLIVEQWGEVYRTMAGEALQPDDVELLAAS
jgi:hypothetical protein